MLRLLIITIYSVTISGGFTFNLLPFHMSWSTNTNGLDTKTSIPYMASLVDNGTHICSGAIINKRTILTAGHCFIGLNKDLTKVGVGLKYRSSPYKLISIKNWTVHENFDYTTMDNDIALVFLAEDIPLQEGQIESIVMAEKNTEPPASEEGTIGCWQFMDKPNSETDEILKVSSSPIVMAKVCSKLVNQPITSRNICAGKLDGSANNCQQESGSVLVVQQKLVGIASWGYGCIKFEEPVVYIKISEFRDWIDSKIKM